jgi:hypothetical protein
MITALGILWWEKQMSLSFLDIFAKAGQLLCLSE